MTATLWLDLETYSETPINRGTDRYARDAEVMIVAYALDKGAVRVWDVTETGVGAMPVELEAALADPAVKIVAHNVTFDRTVLREAMGYDLPADRWRCTSNWARAHALPGGLGLLADVLNVEVRKQQGKSLIHLFCKPRPKSMKLRRATADTHPTDWEAFVSYAGDDVGAMRDAAYAMPRRNFTGDELRLWFADQRINDRGFACDVEFAEAAVDLLRADKRKLDDDISDLTGGEVTAATQRDKLLRHLLEEHGVVLSSMRAKELEALLEEQYIPEHVKELIRIRIRAAMASTSKFTRLLNCVGPDGRLRFTLQFCGASRTGRWSGRTFQPQNLPRPSMKSEDIAECIKLIRARDAGTLELLGYDLRVAASNALRGLLIAPPGRKLIVNDWSNIEGRLAAWHAGEDWKVQAFRDFDTIIPGKFDDKGKPLRKGKDLYVLTVARAYGRDPDTVTGYERQQGKGMELSLGYGGGVAAFVSVGAAYGLDLDELARHAPNILPYEALARGEAIYDWAAKKRRTYGLARSVYATCEAIKTLWRQANPRIAAAWEDLEQAARHAISAPGEVFRAARCELAYKGNWLMVKLPSGRHLMYPSPRILANGTLTYAGQVGRDWKRIKTYGGKLFENVVQASARDVLAGTILAMDDRTELVDPDVFVVLHVHDEVIVEAPGDDGFGLRDLQDIMEAPPSWAEGLPLATDGFETTRYEKH